MTWAIFGASGLLLLGLVLRARVRLLQVLFIPASVIGGLVGLVLLQAVPALDAAWPAGAETASAISDTLRGWPAPLIAVVFAGLLLERPDRGFADAMRGAALAGIMVWIIVLGEVAIGLGATWLIIDRVQDVPPAFGQLIEAGFAGGHGTATALGTVFTETLEFPAGLDLGLFMATVGLVYGVVSGIALVNLAVRRGWTRDGARAEVVPVTGLESRHDPEPVAFGRVRSEVIDPFAFQVVLLAIAFGIGALLQAGFVAAVRVADVGDAASYLSRIPLFLFTLLGGLILRKLMTLARVDDLIDGASIRRLVGFAMEYLIVAAIASLKLSAVAAFVGPLVLLVVLGAAWTVFCLLFLARRLLPGEHWFELGILNYGMSTATTAQGMMLLRIVDKDLESGAAEHYALAAPLSAPFVGGGVITLSLPLVLERTGIPVVLAVVLVVIVGLYVAGRALHERWRAR